MRTRLARFMRLVGAIFVSFSLVAPAALPVSAQTKPVTKDAPPEVKQEAPAGFKQETPPGFQSEAPAGFEALSQPQTTMLDIYFAGRSIGSTMATFSAKSVVIENPIEIVSSIPRLKEAEKVMSALSGPLSPNAHLVCPEDPDLADDGAKDCGKLEPEIAGVILDESKFRLDVFVSPDFLDVYELGIPRYLPKSDAGPSLVSSFAAATSGSEKSNHVYNLRNQTIFGMGEARVRANSAYSSTNQFFIDTVTGEYDDQGVRYSGGMFRSLGMDNVGELKMIGGRYTTTTDTRMDLDVGFGNQLVIFLPRPAQIDIVKDGRLIGTRFYEAGNQTLDTSQLPDGAYDVTLRIRESGAEPREETHFYIKTASLPPKDAPLYFVEGGVVLSETKPHWAQLTGVPIVHAGALFRLDDSYGVGGDLITSEHQAVGEIRGFYFAKNFRARASGVLSSELDLGVNASATGNFDKLTYSLSLRRTWSGPTNSSTARGERMFDPISGSTTQGRANIGYPWANGQWGFQTLVQDSSGSDITYSFGPSVTYPLFRSGAWGGVLRVDAARTQDETVATARVQVRFNEPSYSVGVTSSVQYDDVRSGANADSSDKMDADTSIGGGWRDQDLIPGDLSLTGSYYGETKKRTARLGASYLSNWGRYSLDSDRNWGSGTPATRFSGNAASSFVTDGTSIAFGGRDRRDSGVVVALTGTAEDAEFNVLVDGSPHGTVRVGQELPLMLSPFKSYNVRVEPAGGDFVDFDSTQKSVTLFPGTVMTVSWAVNPIVAVFGKIVRPDGTPVKFARIEGATNGAFTDDFGFFQAELAEAGELVFRPTVGPPCKVVVKSLPTDQVYADLKELVCVDLLLEARATEPDADGGDDKAKPNWAPVIAAYKEDAEGVAPAEGKKQPPVAEVVQVAKAEKPESTNPAPATETPPAASVAEPAVAQETPPAASVAVTGATPVDEQPATETAEAPVEANTEGVAEETAPEPAASGDDVAVAALVEATPKSEIPETPAESESPVASVAPVAQPRSLLPEQQPDPAEVIDGPVDVRIQLAAYAGMADAIEGWRQIVRQAGSLLDDRIALVARSTNSDGGTFRLQAGPMADFAEAKELCAGLHGGDLACEVVDVPLRPTAEKPNACIVKNSGGINAARYPELSTCRATRVATAVKKSPASTAAKQKSAGAASGASGGKTPTSARKVKDRPVKLDYRVQIASFRSRADAETKWMRLIDKMGGNWRFQTPIVARADLGKRGIYYRLQVRAADGRTQADELCRNLKSKGQDCLVVKR